MSVSNQESSSFTNMTRDEKVQFHCRATTHASHIIIILPPTSKLRAFLYNMITSRYNHFEQPRTVWNSLTTMMYMLVEYIWSLRTKMSSGTQFSVGLIAARTFIFWRFLGSVGVSHYSLEFSEMFLSSPYHSPGDVLKLGVAIISSCCSKSAMTRVVVVTTAFQDSIEWSIRTTPNRIHFLC